MAISLYTLKAEKARKETEEARKMGRTNDDQRATPGLGGTAGDAPALDPIRVGDWQVDAALNLLRRGDAAVQLEPKVMELLWMIGGL